MTNDIEDQKIKAATPAFKKAGALMESAVDEIAAMTTIKDIIEARLTAIGIPQASDFDKELTLASFMIGMSVGQLQQAGASVVTCHRVIAALADSPPMAHSYEYEPFGERAADIVPDLSARKLWRVARMLHLAVFDVYLMLRDGAHGHDKTLLELWAQAVKVAEVMTDVYYPLGESVAQ